MIHGKNFAATGRYPNLVDCNAIIQVWRYTMVHMKYAETILVEFTEIL